MGYTLIVNPGSSSKKYALYKGDAALLSMRFEHYEGGFEVCSEINGSRQKCEGVQISQFKNALDHFLDTAIEEKLIVLRNDITRVCVRVVAPGTYFQEHRLIDEVFISLLRKKEDVAPLHIPMLLREIMYVRKRLSSAILVAASDSAFHAGMPALARVFSIDPLDAQEFDIYRFGYHGISLASVMRKIPTIIKDDYKRTIICHIGSGISITAIKDGESIDTSMGYAPGAGLVMGSRAGDFEAEALLELMRVKHMRPYDAHMYLQTQGGLYALSGYTDLRAILERRIHNEEKATFAFDKFVYHIRKTIGSYIAALGGLDALVVTATAAERNPNLRSLILRGMESLGIVLDAEKNDLVVSQDTIISSKASAVDVAVIRTNEVGEMLRIAESFDAD